MSTAKGRWYQSESKLKMPRSQACWVVMLQLKRVIAMTWAMTHRETDDSGPAGPVTDLVPPPAAGAAGAASSGWSPKSAPPAVRGASDSRMAHGEKVQGRV